MQGPAAWVGVRVIARESQLAKLASCYADISKWAVKHTHRVLAAMVPFQSMGH